MLSDPGNLRARKLSGGDGARNSSTGTTIDKLSSTSSGSAAHKLQELQPRSHGGLGCGEACRSPPRRGTAAARVDASPCTESSGKIWNSCCSLVSHFPSSSLSDSIQSTAERQLIMPTAQNSSKHVRKRKIADLSEEQRERKRNTDRQAQQAYRERTKAQIQELEDEVESMRQNSAENEEIWRAENARLREKNRHLTLRLEQIQRLANGRLETLPETSGATKASPRAHQKSTPRAFNPQSPESPGSMVIVLDGDTTPQSPKNDLHSDIPLLGAEDTENVPEAQMLAAGDGVVEEDADASLRPASLVHQGAARDAFEPTTAIASSHADDPCGTHTQDVVMSSYETIPTDHLAATPGHEQWLHQSSLSAHTMSPAFAQPSPQYRRKVHEVVCEHFRTCPFDHILLDLVDARKVLLASGSMLDEVIGPAQADIAGLFQASKLVKSHQISRVLVEMMHTFAHVSLPERAAFMYKIHKTLRVCMPRFERSLLSYLL
jgi:hypothetical protein